MADATDNGRSGIVGTKRRDFGNKFPIWICSGETTVWGLVASEGESFKKIWTNFHHPKRIPFAFSRSFLQ